MSVILTITEGWTQELGPFNLKVDGVAVNLTGFTVALVLRSLVKGTTIDMTGKVRIDLAVTGNVYFTPSAADLKAALSPMTIHWKVTDGAGKIVFFPNGIADQVVVAKV